MRNSPESLEAKFILCEDVRSESHGKVTLIGAYPGDIIVLASGPPPEKLLAGQVAVLPRLAIAMFIKGGNGTYPVSGNLLGPREETIAQGEFGATALAQDKSVAVVMQAGSFPVTEFGRYTMKLLVGGKKFEYMFEIRDGRQAQISQSDTTTRTSIPKKKKKKVRE
jgi:hypothetical protein